MKNWVWFLLFLGSVGAGIYFWRADKGEKSSVREVPVEEKQATSDSASQGTESLNLPQREGTPSINPGVAPQDSQPPPPPPLPTPFDSPGGEAIPPPPPPQNWPDQEVYDNVPPPPFPYEPVPGEEEIAPPPPPVDEEY